MSARVKTTDHGFVLQGESTSLRRLLREMWRARSLVRMMARREFYVRYRRPTLGVLWAVVLPLIQALMLTLVFQRVVRISAGVAYPVFILSGILPWNYFSSTLSTAVRSITAGSNVASKVYFPRATLPLVSTGSQLYGFIPTLVVLIAVVLIYGVPIRPYLLLLIPAVIMMVALTAGFALVFAALQVYFRDVAFVITAVIQAWFYGSAVFYPITLVPKGWLRWAVQANPATGMIELFRVAVVGFRPFSLTTIWFTLGWIGVLFVAAALLYRRYDRVFVDLL